MTILSSFSLVVITTLLVLFFFAVGFFVILKVVFKYDREDKRSFGKSERFKPTLDVDALNEDMGKHHSSHNYK